MSINGKKDQKDIPDYRYNKTVYSYGVVFPIYNEGNRLSISLMRETITSAPENVFIQVVDDGSTDGFGIELATTFKDYKNFSVLRSSINLGKADALILGFKNLIANQSDISYLGFLDADFSAPMEEILNLFEISNALEVDIVCGIRVPKDGNLIRTSWIRRYAGITFTKLSSRILGLHLQDSQCGCKVFKNSIKFRKMLEVPPINQWLFDLQAIILIKNQSNDNFLLEVPLKTWVHKKGSKIKFTHILGITLGLLKLRKYHK